MNVVWRPGPLGLHSIWSLLTLTRSLLTLVVALGQSVFSFDERAGSCARTVPLYRLIYLSLDSCYCHGLVVLSLDLFFVPIMRHLLLYCSVVLFVGALWTCLLLLLYSLSLSLSLALSLSLSLSLCLCCCTGVLFVGARLTCLGFRLDPKPLFVVALLTCLLLLL